MNRALRICYKSQREDSNYMNHLKAKISPLHIRRKCSILSLMFDKARPKNILLNVDDSRKTRAMSLPRIECLFPRSESFRKSICYTGPRYWEILPGWLKN